ncbi:MULTISPECIES: metalloregulator ArsR/SmtB family transcription factor [unclassified Streptomyces]|uniref:ArsR/SmtB family transcription factor n=1 Tax=unclassified Streptomyces TaxID=2593676 RepID=UPI002E7FF4F9|nr:metalloregulator ArsR/SmtB family transcription factor [Streptomyces sp. NBC_00589]WTI35056.1 metalloregulator ArsR/SmtB family transcription factor [Streptomyces sp. NBC_00775]WUB31270.1 metalloregulator ArsR/SmtB family transcription factor [Streptomyces sp. NBC_00589]
MPAREPLPPASDAHLRAPDSARLAEATEVFALLSDVTRLHLLWLLAQEESDVGSLADRCEASRTAVSQHLAKLRLAGLVDTRREGRHVHYSLRDGHLRRLVMEALSHADHRVSGKAPHD